jgi:hypothetical protein
MLASGGAEYPMWALLDAPRPDLRIEWIVGGTPSERFADPAFTPCAIIRQGCEEKGETVRGLPLVYTRASYRLHLQESQ